MGPREGRLIPAISLVVFMLLAVTACTPQRGEQTVSVNPISPDSSPESNTTTTSPSPTTGMSTPLVATRRAVVGSSTPVATSAGVILYEGVDTIWRMNGDGSNKQVVVDGKPAGGIPRYPTWSPSGRNFAYVMCREQNGTWTEELWVANPDGSDQSRVSDASPGWWFRWRVDGTLHFATGDEEGLCQYLFDPLTGQVKDFALPPDYWEYDLYEFSPDGTLVAAITKEKREVLVLDPVSGESAIVFSVPDGEGRQGVEDAVWSPNGDRLAFTHCYRRESIGKIFCDLYVAEANGQELDRLTDFEAEFDGAGSYMSVGSPAWAPDGAWLAFLLEIRGQSLYYIGIIPAQGGPVRDLGIAWKGGLDLEWSPDSRKIAFLSNVRFSDGQFGDPYTDTGEWDIFVVDISSDQVLRLTADRITEMHIDWR